MQEHGSPTDAGCEAEYLSHIRPCRRPDRHLVIRAIPLWLEGTTSQLVFGQDGIQIGMRTFRSLAENDSIWVLERGHPSTWHDEITEEEGAAPLQPHVCGKALKSICGLFRPSHSSPPEQKGAGTRKSRLQQALNA